MQNKTKLFEASIKFLIRLLSYILTLIRLLSEKIKKIKKVFIVILLQKYPSMAVNQN
jgi:hypothetical protein